jgi:2-polyprenyl-3-methyl-5-hydroxy-6-metoxy-1,4-benzoquinol methylase
MAQLDSTYSGVYESETDFDNILLAYECEVLRPRLQGPNVLEMGCGRGVTTRFLSKLFPTLHVVDASEQCLRLASAGVPASVRFTCSYFEKFEPDSRYNSIVLAHVLEHLDDPIAILERSAQWLQPGGSLHIIVPHADSLHRRVGVAMGLLRKVDALNDRDVSLGHRRVYTRKKLREHVNAAGLKAIHEDFILLKIFSNSQLEPLDPKLIQALFKLGHEFPDLCADLYVHAMPSQALG